MRKWESNDIKEMTQHFFFHAAVSKWSLEEREEKTAKKQEEEKGDQYTNNNRIAAFSVQLSGEQQIWSESCALAAYKSQIIAFYIILYWQ